MHVVAAPVALPRFEETDPRLVFSSGWDVVFEWCVFGWFDVVDVDGGCVDGCVVHG